MLPQPQVKSNYTLHAANGSSIATYIWLTLTLDLGLRRNFSWRFIVVEVTKPIIGVDFLSHFKLLVDSHQSPLVDGITELFTCFTRCENFSQAVSGIKAASPESIHTIVATQHEPPRMAVTTLMRPHQRPTVLALMSSAPIGRPEFYIRLVKADLTNTDSGKEKL
jgi:hypothetical protein